MKFKHWISNRPSVSIALSVARKVQAKREPQPMPERWVIAQQAGNHTVRYWRGSSRKSGGMWTTEPEQACHYPSRTVALRDASQMNQRHMTLQYRARRLD